MIVSAINAGLKALFFSASEKLFLWEIEAAVRFLVKIYFNFFILQYFSLSGLEAV